MTFTLRRREKRHEEERAVRKAVKALAWRKPVGLPSGESRVTAPVGLMAAGGAAPSLAMCRGGAGEETVTTLHRLEPNGCMLSQATDTCF